MPITPKKVILISSSLLLPLIVVILICLTFGAEDIKFINILRIIGWKSFGIFQNNWLKTEELIVWDVRFPRLLLAGIVGGSLSIAGAIFQSLLRNPLAEPYVLGVSSGSALGAVIAIITGISVYSFSLPLASFLGGLSTIFIVYRIAKAGYGIHTNTLLLAGVIISFLYSAVIMFLMSIAASQDVRSIFYWLMGDLSGASYTRIISILPYVIAGISVLYYFSNSLNLISVGEESALHLGIEIETVKKVIFIVTSLITGAVVSVSGIIGFVGLIIPHISRMLFGSDHRLLIPASCLLGAIFLIIADSIARTIIAPTELPIGVVTAFLGAPFFIYLLRKGRSK